MFPNEPQLFDEDALQRLLLHTRGLGASDIYLKSNMRVMARVHGRLHALTHRALYGTEVVTLLGWLYRAPNAAVEIMRGRDLDAAYTYRIDRTTSARFRWNGTGATVDGGDHGISISLRELPEVPPPLDHDDLGGNLVRALYPREGLFPKNGIILICGPTGSGKSTLMAGYVRGIVEHPDSDANVLMYESPVEFVFDKVSMPSSMLTSMSIPEHLPSFAAGVRNALRRNPDVIGVGEMRDEETISAGLLAARTGHLVIGTMHSKTVGGTFLRIVHAFGEEGRATIGGMINEVRLIICQELVPSTDGKRVAVREYLAIGESERAELMDALMRDVAVVPSVAARLTRERGQTKHMHARRLLAAGRIRESDERWFAAVEADSAREEA